MGTPRGTRPRSPGWGWSAFIMPQIDQAPIYNKIDFTLPLNDSANSDNREVVSTFLPSFMCPSDTAPKLRNRGGAGRPGSIRNPGQAWSSYKGAAGSYRAATGSRNRLRGNGSFRRLRVGGNSTRRIADFFDGTSNSIIVGESTFLIHPSGRLYGAMRSPVAEAGATQNLMKTGENKLNPPRSAPVRQRNYAFSSLHEGGAQFLFGDGRVLFISENIEHTARSWRQPGSNNANAFDRLNGGRGYGTYQRLFSIADNLPIGEY